MLYKENKGVTLIALVITIVLLILAGVSIATLTGKNGILTQANEATEKTDIGEETEKIELAVTEAKIDDNEGYIDLTYENLQNKIAKQFGDIAEVIENADGSFLIKVKDRTYNVSVDGNVALKESNVKEYTADGVPIPKGFYYVGGSKEEGVVISDVDGDNMNNDAKGNQFVWVPVNSENFETEFVRKDFGTQNIPDENFIDTNSKVGCYYEPSLQNTTGTTIATGIEVVNIYNSVYINGGFYIARYETGNENDNAVSKRMYEPWLIKWGDENENGGAVEKARNIYPGHSHLCYGVEWDAIMRWIKSDEKMANYLLDSTGIGNLGTGQRVATGSISQYQIKNIYDLSGNAPEWTMETLHSNNTHIFRGGSSSFTGVERSISNRTSMNISSSIGFRIAFYI